MSFILFNYFASDFSSSLIAKKEETVDTFQKLIQSPDITVLVVKDSLAQRLVNKVNTSQIMLLKIG